jgi:acyl dehydratase
MLLKELIKGDKFDLGEKSFSENEIIDFAKKNDPLEFHTSIEAANSSRFKGLVTSGSHAFNYFYSTKWVPMFGRTVEAGISVNKWNFFNPIYANMEVNCSCEIQNIRQTKRMNERIICWHFSFSNLNQGLQTLELTVLHNNKEL